MSSYLYMKILESAPERYDAGMAWLSGGRMKGLHERLARLAASPGGRVLDVGTGTGGVALACAARGADVVGIDADAGMLAVARRKIAEASPRGQIELVELGALEIEDRFGEGGFDAATACLSLSELLPEERAHLLRVLRSRLVPGGRLVVADEVVPTTRAARALHAVGRLPLSLWARLSARQAPVAIADLPGELRAAGFVDVEEERLHGDAFAIVSAIREERP